VTIAFIVLWVFALASILGAAVYAVRLIQASASNATEHVASVFERRLAEQDASEEGRRVALYKQQKDMHRTVAASDKAVRRMVDETRHLQEETRLAHERTDRLAADLKKAAGGS
jgi:hypothetical protein